MRVVETVKVFIAWFISRERGTHVYMHVCLLVFSEVVFWVDFLTEREKVIYQPLQEQMLHRIISQR